MDDSGQRRDRAPQSTVPNRCGTPGKRASAARAVFLDFHGTISKNEFWQSSEPELSAEVAKALFQGCPARLRDWMVGNIHTVDVCEQLQVELGRSAEVYCSQLFCDLSKWRIDPRVLETVAELKLSGRKVFLVSDNMDIFSYWITHSRIAGIFNDTWLSCDRGTLKNDYDGVAYRTIMSNHGLDIRDCILVDDSLLSVSTFSRLGGQAFQTRSVSDTIDICRNLLAKQ